MLVFYAFASQNLTPREIDPLEHSHKAFKNYKTKTIEIVPEETLRKWVNLHDLLVVLVKPTNFNAAS